MTDQKIENRKIAAEDLWPDIVDRIKALNTTNIKQFHGNIDYSLTSTATLIAWEIMRRTGWWFGCPFMTTDVYIVISSDDLVTDEVSFDELADAIISAYLRR